VELALTCVGLFVGGTIFGGLAVRLGGRFRYILWPIGLIAIGIAIAFAQHIIVGLVAVCVALPAGFGVLLGGLTVSELKGGDAQPAHAPFHPAVRRTCPRPEA
jgi:hypothetical protein